LAKQIDDLLHRNVHHLQALLGQGFAEPVAYLVQLVPDLLLVLLVLDGGVQLAHGVLAKKAERPLTLTLLLLLFTAGILFG